MKKFAIDIVYDILKTIPSLQGRVYKLNAPTRDYPFVILNTAFGITHQTLQNPAVIVGEGVKIDFYASSVDADNPQGLNVLFNDCHNALIRERVMLSLASQYTFEDRATPNANQAIVDSIYRMVAIYRIRV